MGSQSLDRLLELDLLFVNLQAKLRFRLFRDLLRRNRAKGFSALTRFDGNLDLPGLYFLSKLLCRLKLLLGHLILIGLLQLQIIQVL